MVSKTQHHNLYFGYPDQSKQYLEELNGAIKKGKSGIYVVSGPHRVGKSSLLKDVKRESGNVELSTFEAGTIESFKLEIPFLEKAIQGGQRVLPFTETPIHEQQVLQELKQVYLRSPNSILILDVLSQENHAWQNDRNQKDIENILRTNFGDEVPFKAFILNADPNKIIEYLWEAQREGDVNAVSLLVNQICGLKDPNYKEKMRDYLLSFGENNHDFQDENKLKEKFDREMRLMMEIEMPSKNPERKS